MDIYEHIYECMGKWKQTVNSVYGKFSSFNAIVWVLFE